MRNIRLFSVIFTAPIACVATLWTSVGIGADAPGSRPGDANTTCAQIAAELQPYLKQMSPSITALGNTAQEVKARGEARNKEAAAEAASETAAAQAAAPDPTGLANKALAQAQAQRQRESWKQAEAEDKPLNEKYKAQTAQVVQEGQQMQSDARLQRLLQLAQEKNCH
jgi:hypothetical protein